MSNLNENDLHFYETNGYIILKKLSESNPFALFDALDDNEKPVFDLDKARNDPSVKFNLKGSFSMKKFYDVCRKSLEESQKPPVLLRSSGSTRVGIAQVLDIQEEDSRKKGGR